ncbi:MAG TPA: DUF2306 domain-containing protein [Blastocatellia bacterium]|nr:DUF2306 domain-containing protein [Blastocatellia bacterium]
MRAKFNAKHAVFSVIAIMMVYVIFHNERFVVEPENPVWQHYEPFKWWLLPHALAGTLMYLSAPLQFSEQLRKRFPRLHRITGRLYVLSVFIVGPTGAYIQYFEERMGFPRSFTVLAVIDALLLMGTTLMGFVFAYRRKIAQHRQWMIRSYAVALVFVEARFILGVTGWDRLGVEMVQAVIWSCLALSLLLADLANHWSEIRAALRTPVTSAVQPKSLTGVAEPV